MKQRIKDFQTFEMADVKKSTRLEEYENKQIDQMLGNAILFQKMKLDKDIKRLNKEKAEIELKRDNDPYMKKDQNPETNPVALDYLNQITFIDTKIKDAERRITILDETP